MAKIKDQRSKIMSDHFISIERAESDLLDCAAFIGERIKSSEGHADAMNTIVPRYLAKGDVDLSAELSNAIEDPFSRDKLLIVVAEKCAELDDEDYALQLADAIDDHGLQAQAIERVALVLAGKGHAERAAEVADSLGHPDFVYAGIAVNQAAGGSDEAADATLDSIEFPSARVSALMQIAVTDIENEKREKALALLGRAAESAGEIEHNEERIRAFCDIGNIFIEAKANDRAIEIFDQARAFAEQLDNQHRDFFLVSCSLGFLHAGSSDLADRTLDIVTDKTHMASAMLGFARDHWKKDETEDALDALEEAYAILKSQRENETRDSRSRNTLFKSIAAQFAGFGKSDRAVEIALENQDPDQQMAALSQIARILTAQKEDDIARQTLNMIAEDANRLFALIEVSDGKHKLGETDAAIALLDEAATLAETVPQLSSRSGVLNEIAERFVGLGHPEKARSAAIESLTVASQIRDEGSRAVAVANLATIYATGNIELTEAEKAVMQGLVRQVEFGG